MRAVAVSPTAWAGAQGAPRQPVAPSPRSPPPPRHRLGAPLQGHIVGEETVTQNAWSACPGATTPESRHAPRTSRTAHPRTTGAVPYHPGATRTALGPHTPDRGPSAHSPPSRACGHAASERCRPFRLLRGVPQADCRRGAISLPSAHKPQRKERPGKASPRTDSRGNTRIAPRRATRASSGVPHSGHAVASRRRGPPLGRDRTRDWP